MMNLKKLLTLLVVSFFVVSCSSDDDIAGDLAGVPKGEIVELALRNITLTGSDDLNVPRNTDTSSQKWWTHVISSATINREECGDDTEIKNSGYFAFYPNGDYYAKTSKDGTAIRQGSWSWTSSSKDKITVSTQLGTVNFSVTYLNDNNVVYASVQSEGGCSATTYEQFNDPFFE